MPTSRAPQRCWPAGATTFPPDHQPVLRPHRRRRAGRPVCGQVTSACGRRRSSRSPGSRYSPTAARCGPTRPRSARWVRCITGIAADLNATIEGFGCDETDRCGAETQQKAAAAWAGGGVRPFGGTGAVLRRRARDSTTTNPSVGRPRSRHSCVAAAGLRAVGPRVRGRDRVERLPGRSIHRAPAHGRDSPQMADAAALLLLGNRESAEAAGVTPRGRILAPPPPPR